MLVPTSVSYHVFSQSHKDKGTIKELLPPGENVIEAASSLSLSMSMSLLCIFKEKTSLDIFEKTWDSKATKFAFSRK